MDDTALVIFDWATFHDTELVRSLSVEFNVKFYFLRAYSSHLIQPLDLSVFSNVKLNIAKYRKAYFVLEWIWEDNNFEEININLIPESNLKTNSTKLDELKRFQFLK